MSLFHIATENFLQFAGSAGLDQDLSEGSSKATTKRASTRIHFEPIDAQQTPGPDDVCQQCAITTEKLQGVSQGALFRFPSVVVRCPPTFFLRL